MAKKVHNLSPAPSSSFEDEKRSNDDEQQPNQSPQSQSSSSSSEESSDDETADEPKPKKPSLQETREIDSSDDDSDADDSPPASASPLKPVFSKSVSKSPKLKSPVLRTKIDRVPKLVLKTQQPSKVNKRAEAEIEGEKIDKVSKNKKSKVSDTEKREMEEIADFWSLYPGLCASIQSEESGYLTLRAGVSKEYVKEKIIGMGEEKARKLEDRWKVVSVMRDQLYARRTHALNNLAKVTMDSLKYF